MIDFTVTGEGQVLAGMVRAEADTLGRVRETIAIRTIKLQRHIKEEKLSGQVLKVRTGNLRRSVHQMTTDDGSAIVGIVTTPTVYAPPHEFGATMKARIVEAKRAAALRFKVGGKFVFAKRVNIPAFKMPERSFMRSALDDMRADTEREINIAALGPGVNL